MGKPKKVYCIVENLHMHGALVLNPITCHMFDAIRTNINISFEHAKRISEASRIEDYRSS